MRERGVNGLALVVLISLLTVATLTSILYLVQAQPPPRLTIESPLIEDQTIMIPVCTEFTLEIWIRDIPEGYSMIGFDFIVQWDPTMMEYLYHTTNDHGWAHDHEIGEAYLSFDYPPDTGHTYDEDDIWATIVFHCKREGISQITITSIDTIWLWDGIYTPFSVDPDPFRVTCIQFEPKPVGGEIAPMSSLILLSPLIALATAALLLGTTVLWRTKLIQP